MSGELATAIITTFNRAELLPRSVRSILRQTWRPLELVVVDDGSTDNTQDVLKRLLPEATASGVDMVLIRKENGGVSSARNEALAASRGQYIGLLDDDDESYPNRFELQIEAIKREVAGISTAILDVVAGRSTYRQPKDGISLVTGLDPSSWIKGQSDVHICGVVFRREAYRLAGEFDTSLRRGEDVEWLTRVFHRVAAAAVSTPVGCYERREQSLSWIADGSQYLEYDDINEKMLFLLRERNSETELWDDDAWRERVDRELCEAVRRKLYAGRIAEAAALLARVRSATGSTKRVRRTRNKIWKARLLALVGRRLRHPKHSRFEDIVPQQM